jgi:hypoxanthine phosphoribosyltransferase
MEQPALLFSREQIDTRVRALGAEIGDACAGLELCVVGLMKSGLVFMADLIRAIPLPQTCYFLQSASLRDASGPSALTDIVYSTDIPYAQQHILLVDDIIDTGITLSFLLDHIRDHGPASVRVCTLIDKPSERKVDVHPDWAAFTLERPLDQFIVGYGLGYRERFRALPYLAIIPVPAPVAEGRRTNLSPPARRETHEES